MNDRANRISNGFPNRRQFLYGSAISALAAGRLQASQTPRSDSKSKLGIGLIADVHKDIIHDADDRLKTFVDAMIAAKADAIVQLGDFCIPKPANQPFLDIFRRFPGPQFHVLGNHDTDGGFSREQAVNFLGMPARFYAFDLGGLHFVVLDANDRPPGHKSGYPKFVAPEQLDWLERDLARTSLDTFVISHQSLERPACIVNQADVRAILDRARHCGGRRKVVACLNGHWHIDHSRVIDEIPYVHINSASYVWIDDPGRRGPRLDAELSKRFPYVASTIPYRGPLFSTLEIDLAQGHFEIRGRSSEWLGPGPRAIGYDPAGYPADSLFPGIRTRNFEIGG